MQMREGSELVYLGGNRHLSKLLENGISYIVSGYISQSGFNYFELKVDNHKDGVLLLDLDESIYFKLKNY